MIPLWFPFLGESRAAGAALPSKENVTDKNRDLLKAAGMILLFILAALLLLAVWPDYEHVSRTEDHPVVTSDDAGCAAPRPHCASPNQ